MQKEIFTKKSEFPVVSSLDNLYKNNTVIVLLLIIVIISNHGTIVNLCLNLKKKIGLAVYGLNACIPQNSYFKILIPSVIVPFMDHCLVEVKVLHNSMKL